MSLEQTALTDLNLPSEVDAGRLAFGAVPAYRRFELRQARYFDMVPAAKRLAAERGRLAILDIGSGTGSAKCFLDHAEVEAHWTGVEIDPTRARHCRRLGYHEILDDHDLEGSRLPFADQSFDLIVASHIIEHLQDDALALSDWMRLLKPGGCLFVGVPMHVTAIAALARLRYRLRGRKPYGHCQFYTMGSLRRLVAPYRVKAIRGFRLFSARKWLPLEDYYWFYRASVWFGRRFPRLTQEVNVEIEAFSADGKH